jgi:Uma2 family endonuclease
MSAQTASYFDIVSRLPADTVLTFHDASWQEYEELLHKVSETAGLRISYVDGALTIMTVSHEHEQFTRFFEALITAIRLRLRVNILSFGSATMKRKPKGNEPDACFYVQSADLIGNRTVFDFAVDPPPDIVVEVDIHHDSKDKFSIYSGFAVPELWRFDGNALTIHLLEHEHYEEAKVSRALPILTAEILTRFLGQLRNEGEFKALIAFDEWLQAQAS